MEVILKQPIRNLGDQDDVVKVKPGYPRNYLIPQGLAILATASSKKALDEKKRQAAHKQEFVKQQGEEEAAKLEGLKITIETLAGADGKLFGSVTSLMVANRLEEKGFNIERQRINFETAIKDTGEYVATVDLQKGVRANVKIEVIAVKKD